MKKVLGKIFQYISVKECRLIALIASSISIGMWPLVASFPVFLVSFICLLVNFLTVACGLMGLREKEYFSKRSREVLENQAEIFFSQLKSADYQFLRGFKKGSEIPSSFFEMRGITPRFMSRFDEAFEGSTSFRDICLNQNLLGVLEVRLTLKRQGALQ